MHICENLTFNKFDINFFNEGINNVLDNVSREFNQVVKEKQDILRILTDLLNCGEKTIKVHFTEKSACCQYIIQNS